MLFVVQKIHEKNVVDEIANDHAVVITVYVRAIILLFYDTVKEIYQITIIICF